jgi:hypothetical protein
VRARVGTRAHQTIPPAVRRAVLQRDHHRCCVPGCKNAAFLDIHHIQPRSRKGARGRPPMALRVPWAPKGCCGKLWCGSHPAAARQVERQQCRRPDGLANLTPEPAAARVFVLKICRVGRIRAGPKLHGAVRHFGARNDPASRSTRPPASSRPDPAPVSPADSDPAGRQLTFRIIAIYRLHIAILNRESRCNGVLYGKSFAYYR